MAQVLIVDDEATIRKTLRFLLEDEGYAVEEATDGIEGIEKLRASTVPMVVVLDYMMPGHSGGEIICALATDALLRGEHRFLMMTAQPSRLTPEQRQAREQLEIPLLRKPFELGVILRAIADAAERVSAVVLSLRSE